MKKLWLFLFLFVLCACNVKAQVTSAFACNGQNGNPLTAAGQYCVSSVGTNLQSSGTDTHNVYITPIGTPGTINVIIQGSVKGDFTDAATCGSASTTTTPNLLSCSGIYSAVRIKLVTLTGFTAVWVKYSGTSSIARNGRTYTGSAPIVVSGTVISCPTCGTGTGNANYTGTQNVVPKGSATAHTLGDSSITDDGTNPTLHPNGLDTQTKGVLFDIPNSAAGTTVQLMVCRDSSGNAIVCGTTVVSGVEGVAQTGAGTTGSVGVCFTSGCTVLFDNQTTIGHWAVPSTTVAGELHDSGSVTQVSNKQNFYITGTNSGAATATTVNILTPDVISGGGGGSPPGNVFGPASATDNDFAVFNGTTGKIIKDSGIPDTSAGIVGLFTGCSGTQYLGADGACHTAGGASGALVNITALATPTGCTTSGGACTTSGTPTTVSFASIPTTYNDLIIVFNGKFSDNAAGEDMHCQVGNGSVDTGANYQWSYFTAGYDTPGRGNQTGQTSFTPGTVRALPNGSGDTGTASGFEWTILQYANIAFNRVFQSHGLITANSTVSSWDFQTVVGNWQNVANAINIISCADSGGGNYIAGSTFKLYGRL